MSIGFDKSIVFALDCEPCECCGEPVCPNCEDHYSDCDCPGPDSDPDEED